MTALDDALRSAARTPCLLVASDYDGVVAPIVADPDAAMPDTAAIEALAQLAATPDTHVAMISGRTLRDLRRVTGEPGEVMLLGSHGAETASGDLLSPSQLSIRDAIISEMDQISAASLCEPAFLRWNKGDFDDLAYSEPFYLKEFQAGIPRVKGLRSDL